ncbi:hypothetical protein GT347_15400 [Xylophilus rhododendri]|uniref:Uncharacterized protein n=1 Tax=Xylophilus rhododendri TaxID=2697032 RepID=A0A857J858_9BURK|nr:hypothetical protein [Xylophilus rhododendri]QHI99239.1 hypothetical protein GT347_15400 [Xylophilus rhododendri]
MRALPGISVIFIALALAACGGGSNSPTVVDGGTVVSPGVPDTTVALGATLSGTAATGAALAGAAVTVKCDGASATATTASNGSYSVTVTGGKLPCMIRVSTSTVDLYGIATGSGMNAATANVTPFTQLILAAAALTDPALLFQGFTATSLSADTLATATSSVASVLAASGIDISGASPLSTAFAVGDASDAKLDALQAKLAAATATLSDLVVAIKDGTTGLSTALLTPPAVSACPQFRSIAYRVAFNSGRRLLFTPDFSAGTATVTRSGVAVSGTVAISTTTGCQFTYTGSDGTVMTGVGNTEGILGLRDASRAIVGIGLPQQSFSVADAVGGWNTVEYIYDSSSAFYSSDYSTLQISAAGPITKTFCDNLATNCTVSDHVASLVADSTGALSLSGRLDSDYVGGEPVYAYKSPSGGKVLVVPMTNGGILVALPAGITETLPTVGATSSYFDLLTQPSGSGSASTLTRDTSVVTAVNTSTGAVTRDIPTKSVTGQVRFYNQPRPGMRYRERNSVQSGQIALAPNGTKLTVYGGAGAISSSGCPSTIERRPGRGPGSLSGVPALAPARPQA